MERETKKRIIISVIIIIIVIAIAIALGDVRAQIRRNKEKEAEKQMQESGFVIDVLQGIFIGEGANEVTIKYLDGGMSDEEYLEFTEKEQEMYSNCNEETIRKFQSTVNAIIGEDNQFYIPEVLIINKENPTTFKSGYLAAKMQFVLTIGMSRKDITEEQYNEITEKYKKFLDNPSQEALDDYFNAFKALDNDDLNMDGLRI